MNRRTTITLATMALCLAVSLPLGSAVAEEKQKVSFKVPAENIKFGLQQNVVVGDAPNHIVRVFETHQTFPNNAPVINGLKLAETWQRGIADIADGAGNTSSYFLFVMENGDKFLFEMRTLFSPRQPGSFLPRVLGTSRAAPESSERSRGSYETSPLSTPIAGAPGESQMDIEYSTSK